MKFFDQGNPLLIDIERSLKIENIELLFTFVKMNHHQFTLDQLFTAY
jgi:hypothetical protein